MSKLTLPAHEPIESRGRGTRHVPHTRSAAALVAALLLLVVSTTVVLAQDEALGGKVRTGETVTVAAGETVDGDLYVAGGTVVVHGTVDGDLVAAGGDIQLNGSVTGDLLAAGGTIVVAGTVAGDARMAGGTLTVNGDVGEDLLVAGGEATIGASGTVGEDVIVAAGELTIAGSVAGSVVGSAGTYERTGTVGGSEEIAVDEAEEVEQEPEASPVLAAVRHWIVVVLIGALALWIAPVFTRGAAALVRGRPLASLGVGLLAAIGWLVGVIAVVLLIVVALLLFGLLTLGELAGLTAFAGMVAIVIATFALVVIGSYLADAIVGLALAGFVRGGVQSRWVELGLLAAGAAVVVLATSLPVVGWLLKWVVVLLGLGALTLAGSTSWRTRRTRRPAPPPGPAVPPPAPATDEARA